MWKNITSYSRGEDKTDVRTTQLLLDGLDIVVTKHIHFGDELIMNCRNAGIDQKALGVTVMEEGQKKALNIVENRLKKMLYAIRQVRI
ncbi:MAG: hypothetical protein KDI55_02280 [Anaerolineae bacterium]|nr:hypothetical protein [Anaerolineae bacterium]MCP5428564.1 hypothetical protein [Chromatiaceae bacterium]